MDATDPGGEVRTNPVRDLLATATVEDVQQEIDRLERERKALADQIRRLKKLRPIIGEDVEPGESPVSDESARVADAAYEYLMAHGRGTAKEISESIGTSYQAVGKACRNSPYFVRDPETREYRLADTKE